MELNRNQWFFMGIVILLLGIQFRMVKEYVLTTDATRFLAERTLSDAEAAIMNSGSDAGGPQKAINPPDWLGWCSISVGVVFVLHSLAMRKPG